MDKQLKISASKLSVAEQCELHYHLRYVKWIKMQVFDHPSAFVGIVFHRVVELWQLGMNFSKEALLALVDKAWADKAATARLTPDTLSKTPKLKDDVRVMLETFYRDEGPGGSKSPAYSDKVLGVEKKFEIPWDPAKDGFGNYPAVLLNGFIDRIKMYHDHDENDADIEGAWITDWKTQKELPSQDEVDANVQLTMYAAAYRWLAKNQLGGSWPTIEDYVELYFPRHGVHMRSQRNKAHFDDLKQRLVKVIELEKKAKPQAQPSDDNCRFCEYFATAHCPATKGKLG